ncbi:hypothetical protein EMIT0P43_170102 [Pseudomonas jessenii]|uniref:tail fiber domain-containing protein n=1 Tax=Pseudomonas jessenii TaxID=77298 RepID=UPI0039E150BD
MQPIQFFAARAEDGALLPGATVDVFVQGTQGRAPLFADSPCTVPLGNPVSADANARVFFYTTTPRIDMRISRYGYVAPLIVDISTWDAATAVEWVQSEINAALGEIGDSLAEMEGEFAVAQIDKEQRFRDFLRSSGYEYLGDYDADGPLTVTKYHQVFRKDNELWRAKASLSLPYLTAENWVLDVTRFITVGDAALRQEMANAALGGDLLAWLRRAKVSDTALHSVLAALSSLPVSPWEFVELVTVRTDPDDPDTWDWTPAIDRVYEVCANDYPQANVRFGKAARFTGGRYGVTHPVGPKRLGIVTSGEGSLTSSIYALPSFSGDYVFKLQHAAGAALGGVSVYNLGIDCNGMACGGFNIEDGYDNVIVEDLRISKVHANSYGFRAGPRTDGLTGQTVSQTIQVRGLFVYKAGGGATVPTVYCKKVQEAQFIGCKSWAGGYSGAGRGNTSAWYFEDCRSIHMAGCSAVGAQNHGIEVRAQTKSTDGIFIGAAMLYENCNGTLKTSSADAALYPIKTLVHELPRIEAPSSGGFDLGGLYGAKIDAGVTMGVIQADCDQCQINAQHLPNWVDNTAGSKRNVIDTYPNAIANYKAFSKEIAVVAALSTPRQTLRRGDTVDYLGWEWSSSAASENGGRFFINLGGIQHNVLRYDHTRTFYGPGVDNFYSCGTASFRNTAIWSVSGVISTSDGRLKTAVRKFTEAELRAASALGLEVGIFQWLQSVAEKAEGARFHTGMTVQRAIEVMEENGLDPFGYGFICYDEWDETPAVYAEPEEVAGEDGPQPPVLIEAARPADNRYSFRMDQLYAFIMAGVVAEQAAAKEERALIKENQARIEARLDALEAM